MDLIIEEMDLETAQRVIVDMYCRNGRIKKVGVEKVGMSTLEIHICNALRAKKRYVSKELGNLELLNPRGRSKEYRIESSLTWPLKNGKVHYLDTIREDTIKRLCQEMEKFPMWKDDGIDMLSYVFDMIKSYRFGEYVEERDEVEEGDITAKPDKRGI